MKNFLQYQSSCQSGIQSKEEAISHASQDSNAEEAISCVSQDSNAEEAISPTTQDGNVPKRRKIMVSFY